MEKLAKQLGHSDFMKESILVTPEGKAESPADRSEFDISPDAFVYLVVSTRLPAEMNKDFIAVCNKLIENIDNAIIAFAGTPTFNLNECFDDQIVEHGRVRNLGFQQNLQSICAMCNAYLNPYRQGGGTSSQTAILNGLPVVTRDYGHISAVVPTDHRHATWDSYLTYAARLAEDKDFAAHETDLFLNHFSEHLQTGSQVARIFKKLQDKAAKYAQFA